MKFSSPKACVILAIVVSWLVLLRLLFSHSTPEEVVLPSAVHTSNIIGEIVTSISHREPRISEEEKLKIMGSRNASEVIDPDIETVYIQPEDISFPKQKLSILIMVTTVPKATGRRTDIRSTWMKWAKESSDKYFVRVFFFLGLSKSSSIFDIQELINENNVHNDLIVDNFSEHYFRLTPKTLRILKWFTQTYDEANTSESSPRPPDFLVKTDHDVFINIPNLNSYLSSIISNASNLSTSSPNPISSSAESKEILISASSADISSSASPELMTNASWYFIGGNVYKEPAIETDPESKFFVDTQFWFRKHISYFPQYAGGPMYVLSGNIIPHLYNAVFSVPLFYFEDTYLLGLVANKHLHLKLTDIPGTYTITHKSIKVIRNKFKMKRMISLHPMEPPVQMYNIFNILKGNRTL